MLASMSRTFVVLLMAAFATEASAHLEVLDPPPRYGRRDIKEAPCGIAGGVRGDSVRRYAGGETLEIRIDEFIDHPSHYRVALDLDGDDGLTDPFCIANCDDGRQPTPEFEDRFDDPGVMVLGNFPDEADAEQTLTVTLPDVDCERCVLQVMQIMYDKRPYTPPGTTPAGNDNYYQCVDIAITRTAASDAGPVDAGPDEDAGADVGAARDAGPRIDAGSRDSGGGDGGPPSDDGGCSVGASGSAWPFALVALLAWRRRRGSLWGWRPRTHSAVPGD